MESDLRTGVAIGSYGMPSLIELQVRMLRANLGPVPILVSDDCSPQAVKIAKLCDNLGVFLWTNPARLGHTGGDLAVFWKAIVWGNATGLGGVAKISQRLLVDIPGWLGVASLEMKRANMALAAVQSHGKYDCGFRTECFVMDVPKWYAKLPKIGHLLFPQRRPKPEMCEYTIEQIVSNEFGGSYMPLSFLDEDREKRSDSVCWHHSNCQDDYDALIRKYLGVEAGYMFCRGMWHESPGYVR